MSNIYQLNAFERFSEGIKTRIDNRVLKGRQLQLLWTVTGLLIVQPNEDDFLYLGQRKEDKHKDAVDMRKNGSYAWSQALDYSTLEDVFSDTYKLLMTDLVRIEGNGHALRTYKEAEGQWTMQTANQFRRELRFLIVGLCGASYNIPLDVYQYVLVEPTFGNLIVRGGFDVTQVRWFSNALAPGTICQAEKIFDGFRGIEIGLINGVSFFGRFYLRLRASIMLRMSSQLEALVGESESSSRLISSSDTLRRLTLNRDLTVHEQTNASLEFSVNDTKEDMLKIANAAATFVAGTSIIGAMNHRALSKMANKATTNGNGNDNNSGNLQIIDHVGEDEINRLLRDGIIRPSRSPYNSPIWVVPKKDDHSGKRKYRLVVDFRRLNAVTIADKYPIPDINDVLANLGGNEYFTVLDLKSGFHQINLREEDREKTAFSINNGKFEFTRLPFGLKNAPSIYQRALDDILRQFIGKICYVYVDDIIIFSKDENSHIEHVNQIFETLKQAHMKIQLDKCEFFKREV